MFCAKCGTNNLDGTSFCVKCGSDLTKQSLPEKNYSQDSLNSLKTSSKPGGNHDLFDDLSTTITPETDIASLSVGSLFANRYEILSDGMKGGMGEKKSGCRRWSMADSAVSARALSDRTAFDRDLSSETANFMGYDSPRVSSHPTVSLTGRLWSAGEKDSPS
jgi:hypothetical protein